MAYSLDNLINDCANKKSRTDLPMKEKKKVLGEVWEAFNLWIDSQFEKGKGVNIATFGKLTWEVTEKSITGEEKRRPYFKLAETYCRGNGIPFKKQLKGSALAKAAEINYSILAIRFSQSLTKDQVFTGLRDLLQQLGQVIGSGRKVSIQFHVGKLVAKERKVFLLFDVKRFRDYIDSGEQWNLVEQYFEDEEDAGSQPADDAYEEAGRLLEGSDSLSELQKTVEGGGVPSLQLNSPGRPDTGDLYEHRFNESLAREQQPQVRTPLSGAGSNLMEMLSDNGDAGGGDGDGGEGYEAREKVIEEAYKRHLRNMQTLVDAEDIEQRQMDEQRFQRELLAQMRRREQMEERHNLQTFIKKQIVERDVLKEQERNDWKTNTNASLTMNAPSFHVNGDDMSGNERKWVETENKIKKDLLKSLKYQIDEKEARRTAMRSHELQEEKRFLNHVNNELVQHKMHKQQQAAVKAKQMKDAWSRDNYMKTALKVRREQLARARPSPFQAHEQDDDDTRSVSARSDYSVGFDVRSGR